MNEIKKMDEDMLLNICNMNIQEANSDEEDELSKQRELSKEYYLGKDYGNEVEDQSQVKTSEVSDTIETIKPFLINLFAKNEDTIQFDPTSEGDVRQAQQETAYVRHIFWKQNRGFLNAYSMIHDALLEKSGFIKIYWDDSEQITNEEYTNLGDVGLGEINADQELEILEIETRQVLAESGEVEGVLVQYPQPQLITQHDVKVQRTKKTGKVQIDPVAPEKLLISKRSNSPFPSDSPFMAHFEDMTVGELIADGFDKQDVIDAATAGTEDLNETEELARKYTESSLSKDDMTMDVSMRLITVKECYINVDFDGDGIAEFRKVTIFGNKVQLNEEMDDNPFGSITPSILPHQFHGRSLADLVMDLQLIQSTILRQTLNNMYAMNNQRMGVGENVNLDDLLTTRSGGAVRTENGALPRDEIMPIPVQPFVAESFSLMSAIEGLRESRSGVAQNTQSINENVLNNNKGDASVQQVMSKAEERVVLIAQIMAEGFKDIYLKVRALAVKHQDTEKKVKLMGKWETVNPTRWGERFETTIEVGVGDGERLRQLAVMNGIKQDQVAAMQSGGRGILVDWKHIFNALEHSGKLAGLPGIETFFIDPDSDEAKQAIQASDQKAAEPDVNEKLIELQGEIELMKAQTDSMKIAFDHQDKQTEIDRKYEEMEDKFTVKMTELELAYQKNVPGAAV